MFSRIRVLFWGVIWGLYLHPSMYGNSHISGSVLLERLKTSSDHFPLKAIDIAFFCKKGIFTGVFLARRTKVHSWPARGLRVLLCFFDFSGYLNGL